MIGLMKGLIRFIKRNLFESKQKKRFRKTVAIAPSGCDVKENRLLFRYLCHQLEKAIKNQFDPLDARGLDKYQKAMELLDYFEEKHYPEAPDIVWGKGIICKYELWKNGEWDHSYSQVVTTSESKDFKGIIYRRRSVRFWKNDTIPDQIIQSILEIGVMAPSSCNRQPYKFIVVKNTNKHPNQAGTINRTLVKKAPYIIYIAIDGRLHPEKYAPAIDAGIVAQNIMLAIEYYGYGACAMYHCESYNQKNLRRILRLERHDYIYLAVLFGKPAETPELPGRVSVKEITSYLNFDTHLISSGM